MIITILFIVLSIIFCIGTAIYIKQNKKKENNKISIKQEKKEEKEEKEDHISKKKIKKLFNYKIKDSIISIDNKHSAIIALSTIDYQLLSQKEQRSVELNLEQIALTITYPLQFYSTTQRIDTSSIIKKIQMNEELSSNSSLKKYSNYFIKFLNEISNNRNLSVRKNYAIISYYGDREKAITELDRRCTSLKMNFLRTKIQADRLNTEDIRDLIYKELNKGSTLKVQDLINKGGLVLYNTKNKLKLKNNRQQIQLDLENSIFDNSSTLDEIIQPEIVSENKNYVYTGPAKYTRVFALTTFPHQTFIGWLDSLFNIGEISISVLTETIENAKVINQLTRKLVQLQSEYQTHVEKRKYLSYSNLRNFYK